MSHKTPGYLAHQLRYFEQVGSTNAVWPGGQLLADSADTIERLAGEVERKTKALADMARAECKAEGTPAELQCMIGDEVCCPYCHPHEFAHVVLFTPGGEGS